DRRADALLVVEWGEPHVSALGGDAIHLALELHADQRQARVWSEGRSSRWPAVRARLLAAGRPVSDPS
ncbi:MAG: hypothetical protein KC731_29820, partial [Myxococcales bacterium]|nr:hypothetical protein [Myxococcales bacterium]